MEGSASGTAWHGGAPSAGLPPLELTPVRGRAEHGRTIPLPDLRSRLLLTPFRDDANARQRARPPKVVSRCQAQSVDPLVSDARSRYQLGVEVTRFQQGSDHYRGLLTANGQCN